MKAIIKALKRFLGVSRHTSEKSDLPFRPKATDDYYLSSDVTSSEIADMRKMDKLRYPIGSFEFGKTYSPAQTREHIQVIERLPSELKKILRKIGRSHFDLSYRPGGWTARQIVHHLADAHMNAFIRMKMALTEPTPVIKPYEQDLWAQTADVVEMPVKVSVRLLSALHKRWVALLESLSEEDLEKGYFHPERNAIVLLPEAIALCAWHSQHHLAHLSIIAQKAADEKAAKQPKKDNKKLMSSMKTLSPASESEKARLSSSTKQAVGSVSQQSNDVEERPKMTRAEAIAKARAARLAKLAEQRRKAGGEEEVKPKMTRAEAMAKARAARLAKLAEQRQSGGVAEEAKPKMSRAEAIAKARAVRLAKRGNKANSR